MGRSHGDITSPDAVLCGRATVPISAGPFVVHCNGAVGEYVTLRQVLRQRYLTIAELFVYADTPTTGQSATGGPGRSRRTQALAPPPSPPVCDVRPVNDVCEDDDGFALEKENSLLGGAWVGIIFGVIAAVVLCAVFAWWLRGQHVKQQEVAAQQEREISEIGAGLSWLVGSRFASWKLTFRRGGAAMRYRKSEAGCKVAIGPKKNRSFPGRLNSRLARARAAKQSSTTADAAVGATPEIMGAAGAVNMPSSPGKRHLSDIMERPEHSDSNLDAWSGTAPAPAGDTPSGDKHPPVSKHNKGRGVRFEVSDLTQQAEQKPRHRFTSSIFKGCSWTPHTSERNMAGSL